MEPGTFILFIASIVVFLSLYQKAPPWSTFEMAAAIMSVIASIVVVIAVVIMALVKTLELIQ